MIRSRTLFTLALIAAMTTMLASAGCDRDDTTSAPSTRAASATAPARPTQFQGPTSRAATQPAPAAEAHWRIHRGNPALTGAVSGQCNLPAAPVLRWTVPLGEAVRSSAVIAGGVVYVGAGNGKLAAIDLVAGTVRWTFQAEGAIEAPPLWHAGVVYVGSHDKRLYALDADTGRQRWAYLTGDKIIAGANAWTAPDGRTLIVVGSYDGKLHAVDAGGGAVWMYETANYLNATAAIDGDRAIVGGCDGFLHVVDLHTGKAQRTIEVGDFIASPCAVVNGHAYLGHYGNETTRIRLADGAVTWKYADQAFAFFAAPAVSADRLVIGSRDRKVHALNPADGKLVWTFGTQGKVDSSPVICGDRVVVGSADGRVYILALGDGRELWSYDIGKDIVASPAVAGSMIVIGAEDGQVYAFGSKR